MMCIPPVSPQMVWLASRLRAGHSREAGSHFEMREIDTIFVKGKIQTTRIFELLSSIGELSEELVRLREC